LTPAQGVGPRGDARRREHLRRRGTAGNLGGAQGDRGSGSAKSSIEDVRSTCGNGDLERVAREDLGQLSVAGVDDRGHRRRAGGGEDVGWCAAHDLLRGALLAPK
jgi:hypothetical protein